MRSAPAFCTAAISSPSRAKSADRRLGAMRIGMEPSNDSVALAHGPIGCVAARGIADVAAVGFLPHQREAGLVLRPIDDEGQPHRLDTAGRVKCVDPDVMLRPRLSAGLYLGHHGRRILELEHWYSKHFPVRVARVRIVGVLDGACPA